MGDALLDPIFGRKDRGVVVVVAVVVVVVVVVVVLVLKRF